MSKQTRYSLCEKCGVTIKNDQSCSNCNDEEPDFPFGPIPHWISVKERLPETEEDVLVWNDYPKGKGYSGYFLAYWNGHDWQYFDDYTHIDEKPTHWMPLPKPPSEAQEWISFTNEMPKHNQLVKVKSDNLWHGEGLFQDGKFVYSWVKGACFGEATHWKPLEN